MKGTPASVASLEGGYISEQRVTFQEEECQNEDKTQSPWNCNRYVNSNSPIHMHRLYGWQIICAKDAETSRLAPSEFNSFH